MDGAKQALSYLCRSETKGLTRPPKGLGKVYVKPPEIGDHTGMPLQEREDNGFRCNVSDDPYALKLYRRKLLQEPWRPRRDRLRSKVP